MLQYVFCCVSHRWYSNYSCKHEDNMLSIDSAVIVHSRSPERSVGWNCSQWMLPCYRLDVLLQRNERHWEVLKTKPKQVPQVKGHRPMWNSKSFYLANCIVYTCEDYLWLQARTYWYGHGLASLPSTGTKTPGSGLPKIWFCHTVVPQPACKHREGLGEHSAAWHDPWNQVAKGNHNDQQFLRYTLGLCECMSKDYFKIVKHTCSSFGHKTLGE